MTGVAMEAALLSCGVSHAMNQMHRPTGLRHSSPRFLPARIEAWTDAGMLLSVALLLLNATALPAQERFVEGFSRTRPILRPASDVPAGTIRQIRFGGDAQSGFTLYSAGDDKLVRHWSINDRGPQGVQLDSTGVTSWPIFRAIRGVIYAFDVQRTSLGDRIAFGGVGTKTPQVQLLHRQRPSAAQLLVDPHVTARNAVYAVAFRPDQRQLAVGHDLKSLVLLWDLDDRQARGAATIDTGMTTVWYLAYNPSGGKLAVAGRKQGEGLQVQVWDCATQQKLNTSTFSDSGIEVFGLVWAGDDIWVAATNQGLRMTNAKQAIFAGDFRALTTLRAKAGYVVGRFNPATRTSEVMLFDRGALTPHFQHNRFSGSDIVVQESPDGQYLAAGGMTKVQADGTPVYAIRLWRAATGELLAQIPDERTVTAAAGAIANVGIVPGGVNAVGGQRPYKLGFGWGTFSPVSLPAYSHEFRRFNRQIDKASVGSPLGSKQFDRTFAQVERKWYLQRSPADRWGPLPSWGARVPKCYAHNEHFLVLGYSDGLLVCNLRGIQRGQADDAILRSYYGHESQVTCMDFAPDGNLLVSGSLDGTICGWRINDLNALIRRRVAGSNENLPRPSELLTSFGIFTDHRGRQFGESVYVAADPPAGSPGAEAGLRFRDRIIKLEESGRPVTGVKNILEILQNPVPGKELRMTVGRPFGGAAEQELGIITTVSHDPLWTLYPQRDGNWVLWTPEGNFDASPEMIDRLEWHFDLNNIAAFQNSRRNEGGMVVRGRDFKELYFRPDLFDTLLEKHTPDVPQAAVIPPSLEIQMRDQNVLVTAEPNGREAISEIEIWLNGCRLARFDAAALTKQSGSARTASATILPHLLRADGNQIVAVAAIDVRTRQAGQATKVYNRMRQTLPEPTTTIAEPERRLHYLGIGVTDLHPQVGLPALRYAGQDVMELRRVLQQAVERSDLAAGDMKVLAAKDGDGTPTERQIHDALQRLGSVAKANDLVLVLLSGHGISTSEGYRFVAQDTAAKEQSTISDRTINDYLAQLPCRALLMLDTCHAEGVQQQRTLQDWPGLGLGPQILTSCDSSQESFEHEELGLPEGSKGHGLFTAALLEGLTGRRAEDRGPEPPPRELRADGVLSVDELCHYVKRRTEMLSGLDLPFVPSGKTQQMPKILPSLSFADAGDFVLFRLPQR
jgi:WD40 repeat protein